MKEIFDNDRIFFPEDPELRVFGSVEKLAQWRHKSRGPAHTSVGRRIAYFGSDLNAYLANRRVDPSDEAA